MNTEHSLLSFWRVKKYNMGICEMFLDTVVAKHIIHGKCSQELEVSQTGKQNSRQNTLCISKILKAIYQLYISPL